MKSSNALINTCSILSTILGLAIGWNKLSLNINSFGWDFIIYVLAMSMAIVGVLTLFREESK
jgi:uncharacterized membrane protein